ncbi:MAG: hypothetical protein MJ238_06760 [Bacilli bacterium]|nr:hypothetical protein [Bacilli bacterium]
MLTFGTFFSYITSCKKQGGIEVSDPTLFQELIKIVDSSFRHDCTHASSFAATLRKYKNDPTRWSQAESKYYKINENTYKTAFVNLCRDSYDEVLAKITEIVDTFFDLSNDFRREHFAMPLLRLIDDDPIPGNTLFLKYTKHSMLHADKLAMDELLLEVWAYVVKHGEIADPEQSKTLERIEKGMHYKVKFYLHKKDDDPLSEEELIAPAEVVDNSQPISQTAHVGFVFNGPVSGGNFANGNIYVGKEEKKDE